MVDSLNKGNSYENRIARAMTVWLAPSERRAFFQVCPIPQLWFRRRQADNNNIVTDWEGGRDLLHKPGLEFPFAIECKKQEGWTFDGFANDSWPVTEWWDQAVDQSAHLDLIPLLVFTRNHAPDYAAVPEEVASCLSLCNSSFVLVQGKLLAGIVVPLSVLVAVPPSEFPKLKPYRKR